MSGIVGIIRENGYQAQNLLLYGLYALQHRGQVNAGLMTLDENELYVQKGVGQVKDIFREDHQEVLLGNRGIAHVKYGEYMKYDKLQPVLPQEYEFDNRKRIIAVDGNVTNSDFDLYALSVAFKQSLEESMLYLSQLQGAFGMVYLDHKRMIGARDPWGLKPLCIGEIDHGYMIASETCAIDSAGGTLIKMLEPGELVYINGGSIEFHTFAHKPQRTCLFEMIYVSRPDSYMDSISIYSARNQMGQRLYHEKPTQGDIVIGAPDSGLIAAIGYAEASKIPYKDGIIKNRYIGRTFINPDETLRTKDIFIKLNPIKEVLKDKVVILVDDSIIRGSTIKRTVQMLKEAGAKEVHVRISSPMVKHSCHLALDLPSTEALIASQKSVDEICQYIQADSLYYLSLEGLKASCGSEYFCDQCFTGNYPIEEER